MTYLYYDPLFLEHQTGKHPENGTRVQQAFRHLQRCGLVERVRRPSWKPASAEDLARVHDPRYMAEVAALTAAGGGRIEQDTVCSLRSWDVARHAAGAVGDAVRRVLVPSDDSTPDPSQTGPTSDRRALCLLRPPGHHALADSAMGFCLLNNVAVGARIATDELGLDRVLIVDWDVHHGNGTQEIFWEDPRVGFLSIHRWPFYPGSGRPDETGTGRALGTKLNLPIEMGTSRSDYLDRFRRGLETLASTMRPQLVLVSAGFDSHREDPVGSLGLELEDFGELTDAVMATAREYAGGRIVSVLEGGYNPGILAGAVELHLNGLLAAK